MVQMPSTNHVQNLTKTLVFLKLLQSAWMVFDKAIHFNGLTATKCNIVLLFSTDTISPVFTA